MLPIGPWRCLPMMTSALPCSALHLVLPLHHRLDVVVAGLLALLVVLLAEHEHHHVGVLLDGAGFAQVGELRALVLAALDLARELGEGDDRDVQLLGDRLQALGDLGDLLHAALGAGGGGAGELEVVDDQHVEAVLALQAPGAGGEGGDRQRRRVVDEERAFSSSLAASMKRRISSSVMSPCADLVRGHAGGLGEDAGGELLGGHFQREEADDAAFDRALAAVGPRALACRPWRC